MWIRFAWDQGAKQALPAVNYVPGVSLEDCGPGGNRPGWDQVATRE